MPVRAQRIQHVMQDTIINFYSTSDDYGDFSNFAAWPIKVDGKTWP
ncbi:N-glycosidase YbiA, partial [Salmonella enterica]|nr:N-glycosidase YbiA [Salmonella enterica]